MKPFLRQTRYAAILIAAIITMIAGFIAAQAYLSRSACDNNTSFIETQNGHLRRLDRASSNGRIVFLGSSTFQGLDTSAITPLGLNLSTGSDTLSNLVRRASDYRSLATARAVVINIGLNDLMQTCHQPETKMQSLLALVPTATPIVLVGIQAVTAARKPAACDGVPLSVLISGFNDQLLQACNDRKRCQFIENPIVFSLDDATRREMMETDGIHLSPAGYALLSRKIRNALSNVGMPDPLPES